MQVHLPEKLQHTNLFPTLNKLRQRLIHRLLLRSKATDALRLSQQVVIDLKVRGHPGKLFHTMHVSTIGTTKYRLRLVTDPSQPSRMERSRGNGMVETG